MKKETKLNDVRAKWALAVERVVNGEIEKFDDRSMDVVPDRLKDFFESIGWEHVEPEDGGMLVTNGWQWDWWMDFRKGKRTLTAAGSGFYGGFALHPKEQP